ncbi:hem peroxidase [Theobroma cacao]|nr:hem peroxidase [Theobroma cacao]
MTLLDTLLFYVSVIHLEDKFKVWHRLPVFMGLVYLGMKRHLHQRYNLLHVGGIGTIGGKYDTRDFCYNTTDRKCNHPSGDVIGNQGTFFGRNMLPSTSNCELRPCPYTFDIFGGTTPISCSHKLLVSKRFIDIREQFNMIASSWIQFMIHDWIDHLKDTQ